MQANDFDDLFAQQLGRLPAPDFSERDWREVENRLVINRLQRKLTALTWALPLLGAVSLAMAGGLYHQLRQAHREIEELKKTTAAVTRRAMAVPQPGAPRSQAGTFDALTQTAATAAPATDRPVVNPDGAPTTLPGDAPLPAAPVPESASALARRAASGYSANQSSRSISQPSPASESTITSSVEKSRVQPIRPGASAPRSWEDVTGNTITPPSDRRTAAPRAIPLPTEQTERQGVDPLAAAPEATRRAPGGNATVRQPNRSGGGEAAGNNRSGTESGGSLTPSVTDPALSTSADATHRTAWGENLAGLRTRPPQSLPMEMDPVAYRRPLVAAARRTVPRYGPVETKGEIRRTEQPAPFRLSHLLDATSVGLHLGVPTSWGNGLPAGRGSVLGGQVAVRLTPRWQAFADVSSQRIVPESDPRRFLKGLPIVRSADPDLDFVGMRVNDLSLLNVGAGVNFVVTDRFRVKPYLGLGYNLQVPRQYDVSYLFIKRPPRWPPRFPIDKEERIVSLRDRFAAQRTGQFRLQGGVRFPVQPNLNMSLEGFLNTQFRRLPSLTDTGGLRVGLAYEF